MSNFRSQFDLQEEAASWLARRHSGRFSRDDERAFQAWLDASPDHRRTFSEAESLWGQMGGLEGLTAIELSEARRYVEQRRRVRLVRRLGLAAGLALVIGGAWWLRTLTRVETAAYRTAVGQRLTIDLPDSTRLELGTASEAAIRYSRSAREVHLARGQAVLTVRHDSRPFDVFAGGGRVRDIGTQFEVRHRDGEVEVAVLDGQVEVQPDGGEPVRAGRGQGVRYGMAGSRAAPYPVDLGVQASWRQGILVFRGRPLREVLYELGRYHEVSIEISPQVSLETAVTGTFPTDDLPQALRTLGAALGIPVAPTGGGGWRLGPRP